MPNYDYKCEEHGYFEQTHSIAERDTGTCPTCNASAKKVLLSAPRLLVEQMADAGFPGALHTSGDRMTKKHTQAGQYHTASKSKQAELNAGEADRLKDISVTPA